MSSCKKVSEGLLDCCLYFTLNKFTRELNKLADDIFKKTGLAPNYAFALMQINENPGIASSDLAKLLSLSPSTITRFVDKLIVKGLCKRVSEGKSSFLYLTDDGKLLLNEIQAAWSKLYKEYSKIIGEKEAVELTKYMNELADRF